MKSRENLWILLILIVLAGLAYFFVAGPGTNSAIPTEADGGGRQPTATTTQAAAASDMEHTPTALANQDDEEPIPTNTTVPTVVTEATPTPMPEEPAPDESTSTAAPEAADVTPITTTNAIQEIPVYTYQIINEFPHDPNAFTQGLQFVDGELYEGTGLNGRSTLRRVELETGNLLGITPLPEQFFGEGITVFGDKIYQLTWKAQIGFIYDKQSLRVLSQFGYPTEGWGITHDGERLIMSDGTDTIYFWDPQTVSENGRIQVTADGSPVTQLNELEYINGEIFANIWRTDRIARIDPASGNVIGWIDLTGLLAPEDRTPNTNVLNGIAYDPAEDRLFVTGKLWPKLFEIELMLAE